MQSPTLANPSRCTSRQVTAIDQEAWKSGLPDRHVGTPTSPGNGHQVIVFSLLVLIGVVATYSNHFHNGFHFDDSHTIVNNAFIRDLRNVPLFFRDAQTFSALPANQSYRPIVSTILAVDYRLGGGLDPVWFHGSIFLSFLALVLLLGFLIHHLLETAAPAPHNCWLALLGAGWFALHPANADTVNYVIACSDVFSTLAVVGSLAVYVAFPKARTSYLYLLPAALGILAKPIAAVFAPLLVSYWWLFGNDADPARSRPVPRWVQFLQVSIPAFFLCGALSQFVQHMTPKTWVAGATSAHQYLITQPYVVLLYFQTFFWPRGLSADYDLAPFLTTADPRFWAGVGFLVLLTACALVAAASRRLRVTGFGLLWFLLALAPTSLWPLAEVMNSHRTFFAYGGLVIACAGLAATLLSQRTRYRPWAKLMAVGVATVGLGASGYATYQRNQVWQTEESLWYDVTVTSPENGRGLMNYGLTRMVRGDYRQALDYFHRAQRYTPAYPTLFINIAIAEGASGQPAQAERDFQQALRLAPENPNAYTYYARWLLAQSRAAAALGLLRQALELSPADLLAHELMDSAQSACAAGSPETNPAQLDSMTSPEVCLNLSLSYYNQARYPEAIAAAQKALQLRPSYPAAYNNICAAYHQLGEYAKAVAAGEQALHYQPDFQLAANNLQSARQKLKTP